MHTVRDILAAKASRPVVRISEESSAIDAARLMNEHRIGSVVVTRGERVVGIFTERDILTRVVAVDRSPRAVRVSEVMTAPVACCALSTTRDECRSAMRHERVRHLPVVENDRLVGMVSIGDLLADAEEEQADTIRWLHDYLYGM